jgi:hypothetical protein
MLGCSQSPGDSEIHESFAVNYCLNRYALRLIPAIPNPRKKTGLHILGEKISFASYFKSIGIRFHTSNWLGNV